MNSPTRSMPAPTTSGSPAAASWRRSDRRQDGVASIEFVGLLPLILFIGAFMWQLLIFGGAAAALENAARDGSRVAGQGADRGIVATQVRDSLPAWLDDNARVTRPGGTTVEVSVPIPILFPGVSNTDWRLTRRAELPETT